MEPLKFRRHIFDEVNGSIGITEVENQIIDTPIYQRLRRIQHLACVSLIYPGATHTRFSHSLGTMFIMDKFARSLGLDSDPRQLQLLRLVALLHDIGHLPFSHTADALLEEKDRHAQIGQHIIQQEPISGILRRYDIDPGEVVSVLTKSSDERYSVLIDSDLDVDKVDYLTRDAHHTGVVYGVVDVDRLTRTMYFDPQKRLCVQYRGKQALENFLLARYYMYSTVYQHSTVASFELMMRLIFDLLVKEGKFLLPSNALSKGVSYFETYNDDLFLRTMVEYEGGNEFLKELIRLYFRREPLKCVYEATRLARQKMPPRYHSLLLLQKKRELLCELADAAGGVPKEWIFIEETKPIDLVSREEAAIRIQLEEDSDRTVPIAEDTTSIVSGLRDVERVCMRIYAKNEHKGKLLKALKERYFMQEDNMI